MHYRDDHYHANHPNDRGGHLNGQSPTDGRLKKKHCYIESLNENNGENWKMRRLPEENNRSIVCSEQFESSI